MPKFTTTHLYRQAFCLLLLISFFLLPVPSAIRASNIKAGTHPDYLSYNFGKRDKVVVLGSQPLGVLHSVLPEVMRRDRILTRALALYDLQLLVLPFYNGPDINHFMAMGKVDIAMAGDFPTLTIASTNDVELVAIVKRDRASIVTRSQYTTLRELKNKRVGFPAGTSSHLGLLVVLEANGLKESDVKMIPMKIDELTSALVNGKIDAFAAWEPIPASAVAKNKNVKRVSEFLNTDFIYWTEQFSIDHPEAARHLLAAYLRALSWLVTNEAHLTQAATWSIASTQKFLKEDADLSLGQFKQQIRKNLKLIGSGAIPLTEFADNSYLSRAFSLLKDKGLMEQGSSWQRVQGSVRPSLIQEILLEPDTYQAHVFDYNVD